MADLYTNENFPLPVVEALRSHNHNVLTSYESGKANQAIPDEEVLAFAKLQKRILVTFNRKHFIILHNKGIAHSGIIACTFDPDFPALASRIDAALSTQSNMEGQLVRINRPQTAQES